ncbi:MULTISPECIES: hypothetical protein [Rhizobium]|uniref:hypothetical protein n=1 Tax=Rhizobium TaxID=379 RepID=UPI0007EB36E4|nr:MULTISPECIES: hypothetical protein [Rhizobium]ANK92746.1 hypothetical protein AMK01_CH03323 [Rhizobium sp. N6212]ANK98791.1 hypothetical protein AMK00_CH03327 [Rhizobium sp. N621]ANL04919.1 hypothetical protein AMJ99_CH03403 [Rhizobium esperanzae]ANL10978.1 hypothetical protein AMJ98_CH03354 [Rhizobium sp. N1341]ANL23030.1 hypothetical protein AMJ96_CH03354 [Rhizobium sp. N113]
MSDQKKDAVDNFIDFILSDDTPLGPEDAANVQMVRGAIEQAEMKLAKLRLERARAGAFSGNMAPKLSDLDVERARGRYDRAKAGDATAGLTLAARFGNGSMDDDLEAILEDLAELEDEDNDNEEN